MRQGWTMGLNGERVNESTLGNYPFPGRLVVALPDDSPLDPASNPARGLHPMYPAQVPDRPRQLEGRWGLDPLWSGQRPERRFHRHHLGS